MKLQRRSNLKRLASQRGMGLLVILLIIGLLVAIAAAVAALSRGQNASGDSEKSRLDASTVISQGGMLVGAAMRYSQDRPLANMELTTNANVGLYDPALALASQSDTPSSAMASGSAGAFAYDLTSFTITGLGSGASPTLKVAGLKDAVCKQINKALYGDSIDATLPTAVGSRQEGCAALSGSNTYWKVVVPG